MKALKEERKKKQIENGKKPRKPTRTPGLTEREVATMKGFLFADKGYISKDLFLRLMARGLKIITGIKRTIKNILMSFEEKILLRKRSLVETVFDYLKNKFMLEHSRHRSFINMLVHIISTLTAYQFKSSKPSVSCLYFLPSNP